MIEYNPLTKLKGYPLASTDYPKYPPSEGDEITYRGFVLTDEFGTGICFDSSRTFHQALTGTSLDRIHIELTLMRTLKPIQQRTKSSFMMRHYTCPSHAYS